MRQQSIKSAMLLSAILCGYASAVAADHADRDQPIHLEADQVNIDDARQISTFTGKVLLTQGTLSINGEQIIVVQGKQGFEHGTATGHPAGFRQKREGMNDYVEGYGERIEHDAVNGVMNIYGQAHVKRGQDDVRGDHITYNLRTESFQVSGAPPTPHTGQDRVRVRVEIQPNAGNAASAVPSIDPLSIKSDTKLINPERNP